LELVDQRLARLCIWESFLVVIALSSLTVPYGKISRTNNDHHKNHQLLQHPLYSDYLYHRAGLHTAEKDTSHSVSSFPIWFFM
jgi:hypothetical protein